MLRTEPTLNHILNKDIQGDSLMEHTKKEVTCHGCGETIITGEAITYLVDPCVPEKHLLYRYAVCPKCGTDVYVGYLKISDILDVE